MSGLVITTGVTGVGKDYLLDRSLVGFPHINRRNFGTELGISMSLDRDSLGLSKDDEAMKARILDVSRKMSLLRPLFLSSHVVTDSSTSFDQVIGVESIIGADSYLVVTASPELICERIVARNRTGERSSVVKTPQQVAELQDYQIDVVRRVCGELGSKLTVIDNASDQTQANVTIIQNIAIGMTV